MTDKPTTDELIEQLKDLLKQATVERSHYYVGSRCVLAIERLRELQTENQRLREALIEIEKINPFGYVPIKIGQIIQKALSTKESE